MPSTSFAFGPAKSFYLAVRGPGETFYAVADGQIWHVDDQGNQLKDFSSPFAPGSGITAICRDPATGDIYAAGALGYDGGASSAFRLHPDGSIANAYGNISLITSAADYSGNASYLPCIASDGAGGCYVGGPFDRVNGNIATGLVHLLSTGAFNLLPRLNTANESPICIAPITGAVMVVQNSVIYKCDESGASPTVLVQPGDWNVAKLGVYDVAHGLAVVGQTSSGAKIFVYDSSGKKLASFQQFAAFVSLPSALGWDSRGRLVVGNAKLITSSDDGLGVKRLLPDGSLDPEWSRTLTLDGAVGSLAVLDHSVIVSGAYQHVDGVGASSVIRLSGDNVTGQMANQSVLGFVDGNTRTLVFGVVIKGNYYVDMLARASGPSLGQFGVSPTPTTTMMDVYLNGTLFKHILSGKANGPVYSESSVIKATTPAVGAFAFITGGFDEAEALLTLAPGAYTFAISCPQGDSGQVLGEAYYP